MSLKLEVGKKYLDIAGYEWEVTGIMKTPKGTLYAAKCGSLTTWLHASSFVSEVPTTPTLKAGDRVKVVLDNYGFSGTILELPDVFHPFYVVRSDDTLREISCRLGELTLLADGNASYVPHAPACTCETFLLMREGCKCGHARVAIEQEFKQRGWR